MEEMSKRYSDIDLGEFKILIKDKIEICDLDRNL